MNLRHTLQRLLELEAQDSHTTAADFKLGYLLTFVSNCTTTQQMQQEADKRIKTLVARLAAKVTP